MHPPQGKYCVLIPGHNETKQETILFAKKDPTVKAVGYLAYAPASSWYQAGESVSRIKQIYARGLIIRYKENGQTVSMPVFSTDVILREDEIPE